MRNGGIYMRNGGISMRNGGIETWNKVYLYKEGLCWTKILLKGKVWELRKLSIMNDKLQLRERGKKDEKRKNKLKMGVNVG